MGIIADKVATMRGCSLREIVDKIEEMERGFEEGTDAEFMVFWTMYPNKTQKPVAFRAFVKARKRRHTAQEIMDGLHRYLQYKPADRPWLNPSTFLNQDRFLDQPAAVASKGADLFFNAAMETMDAYAAGTGSRENSDRSLAGGLDQRSLVHYPGHR